MLGVAQGLASIVRQRWIFRGRQPVRASHRIQILERYVGKHTLKVVALVVVGGLVQVKRSLILKRQQAVIVQRLLTFEVLIA